MSTLTVHYIPAEKRSVTVGQLAEYQGRIYFEYDPAFLCTGLEFSPFKLLLKTGAVSAAPPGWLVGLFNDSLPDGLRVLYMVGWFFSIMS